MATISLTTIRLPAMSPGESRIILFATVHVFRDEEGSSNFSL